MFKKKKEIKQRVRFLPHCTFSVLNYKICLFFFKLRLFFNNQKAKENIRLKKYF